MSENPPGDSAAWIVALDSRFKAAVGLREMVHFIENPVLLEVPLCPPYCRQVLIWNDILLPAIDLFQWLQGEQPVQRSRIQAGIFAYQRQAGMEPEYGALLLADIPVRVQVNDHLACALPRHPDQWRDIAISCFRQGNNPIPILDLTRIFAGGLL